MYCFNANSFSLWHQRQTDSSRNLSFMAFFFLPLNIYWQSLPLFFNPSAPMFPFCPSLCPLTPLFWGGGVPLLSDLGGSGGDSARRGERSDVQGVFAVGVRGQSPGAAGGPVGSPKRGPRRFRSGSGCHHAASAFHEVPTLIASAVYTNTSPLCLLTVIGFRLSFGCIS